MRKKILRCFFTYVKLHTHMELCVCTVHTNVSEYLRANIYAVDSDDLDTYLQ